MNFIQISFVLNASVEACVQIFPEGRGRLYTGQIVVVVVVVVVAVIYL